MMTDTKTLAIACIAATVALVWAEFRNWPNARRVFKTIASTAFVLVALRQGAVDSFYGRLILAGLVLSWVGDMLLLSARSRIFLLGIASFLLAHVAFSAAFSQLRIDTRALAVGLAAMTCAGAMVLRWLWPNLKSFYRGAVVAYVAAIVAMCSLAISVGAAPGAWPLVVGAMAFAASDISVARNRFVSPGFANKSWGLPLYYAAQLVIAFSVGGDYIHAA